MGWTEPPPPEAEIGQHYPETYLGETAMMISEFKAGLLEGTRSWRREEEKVAVVERFCQGGRLLDVGCAEGKFLWALDSERWQPCGVEVDSKVVRLARTEFPQIEYVAGDIFSSDLTRHAFDVVTFWHSFEHLYHPRRVLSQLVEIIRPNGVIFISLPNFASLQASWFRRHWFQFDVPRHIYHFSPRSLEILLQEAGLKIEAHLFFSKLVNMHSWKHSALSFFEDWSGSRLPYYLTKPILLAMPLVEWFTGRPGTITTVARKKK